VASFLFAQPTLLSGAARSLDLWGQFDAYNVSRSARQADARAMYNDWRAVGQMIADTLHVEKQQAERERASGVKT
jgi:hypothetical protein